MSTLQFIWLVITGQFDQHLQGLIRHEMAQDRCAERSRVLAAIGQCPQKVRLLRRTRMQ